MSAKGGGGSAIGGALAVLIAVVVTVVLSVALVPLLFVAPPEPEETTCVAVAETTGSGPRIPNGWGDEVEAAAEVAGMPTEVLAAQLQAESNWDPYAVSHAGAAGLSQFMPGTWEAYGEGDPFDPIASIKAQGVYMKVLMDLAAPHAGGDTDEQVKMALAAYNWGPGSMASVGWDWSQGPAETRSYVPKIIDLAQVAISSDCAPVLAGDIDLGPGEWTSPLPSGRMTGAGAYGGRNVPGLPAWAQNHVGIDLATIFPGPPGKILAPTDLRVTAVYEPDGCVMARQIGEPGFGFAFCHMDTINVSVGQEVKRGGELGVEGTRAASVGGTSVRHLHTELYLPGHPDPQYPGPSAPGVTDPTPIYRAKGAM